METDTNIQTVDQLLIDESSDKNYHDEEKLDNPMINCEDMKNDNSFIFLESPDSTGTPSDASDVIATQQRVIQLIPKGHPDLPSKLCDLGVYFLNHFERFGDIANISKAIAAQRMAIRFNDSSLVFHNSLANSLSTRFQHCGDINDISEAIILQQNSVNATSSSGHPNLPGWLNNLGVSFSTRFQRFGNAVDLSEAIATTQRAVQLTPKGHPDLPSRLSNLGSLFQTRFQYFGDVIDISEAISLQRQAVELTSKGQPSFLNNLGISYFIRFQNFGNVADISEAIILQQRAVDLTSSFHADLPSFLINLGASFRSRFRHSRDIGDVSEAISAEKRAIQLTAEAHPTLPLQLNNLGISFRTRFHCFRDVGDISEAISLQQKAAELTPEDHPSLSIILNNLGDSFETQYEYSADHLTSRKIITSAISQFRLAATSKFGSPSSHLQAAKNWVTICQRYNFPQVLEAYATLIALISQVAGIEQTIELRHTNLIQISTLASVAAAAAFEYRQPVLALEWLEQGRCLVWNQLNQLHDPQLDDLYSSYPDIGKELYDISKALATAGSRQGLSAYSSEFGDILLEKVALEDSANAHIQTADRYNKLLENIRELPGFCDFLRPRRPLDIIRHTPKSGTVILINVHPLRCDAIALIHGHKKSLHIPLRRFTQKMAEELCSRWSTHLSHHGFKLRDMDRGGHPVEVVKRVEIVLRTLWVDLVQPIFNALEFYTPESEPRRIWWCMTGPLASLPIHAAGVYGKPGLGNCVSDFAISSYIPTVSMLVDKIKNMPETHNGRLLLVSQASPNSFKLKQGEEEKTITLPKIPGVNIESKALEGLMKSANIETLHLTDDKATIWNVKNEMIMHQSIHLACHGTQDFENPLRSGFYLLDGRLQLSEIIKQHNPDADLAFLSACETSTGNEKLSDEAVHLAAGMLAAGYRSVVGTMWSIRDNYGSEVAEDFYSELLKNGKSRLDGAGAAFALHYATQRLRKKVGDADSGLLIWTPYVHYGI